MYIAKIPGTKYITSLESQSGAWFLRLKLGETVEAELDLEQLSNRNLHHGLGELFGQVSLQINSFQIDLIHKELIAQIQHLLLQESQKTEKKIERGDDGKPRHDPRVDELFSKLDKLEGILEELSARVERMEAIAK